jgi:hypothetical protein
MWAIIENDDGLSAATSVTPRLRSIDEFLGELKGLGIDPGPFSARISSLELEPAARRSLLADSLLLDLAAAVKNGREHARLLGDLRARAMPSFRK